MTDRDTAVWGLVGGLSFLVAVQGFELATGQRVGLLVKLGVAVLVTVVAAVLARGVTRRLANGQT